MKRNVRVLLGWFERHDAITALLGFRMPEPGENVSAQVITYETQRSAVLARPAFVPPSCVIEPFPPEIEEHGKAVLKSLEQTGQSSPHPRLKTGIVDLTCILSIQKAIALDDIAARVGAVSQNDWQSLADLCLPLRPVQEDLKGTFDKDGKGVTISSLNPNLRVGVVQNISLSEKGSIDVIGFPVSFGSPHVSITEYKDRYFLKDGYHRCYGLLSRNIRKVPAIYQKAESFADIHSGNTSLISQEHLLGNCPPSLTDFLDVTVSSTVSQQAFRKAVRIRAEEFVINL